MTQPLIELRNCSKRFGNVQALESVSLTVMPGEVTCLLGDNGAGKSTLIKILSGFHHLSSGEYLFNGQHVEVGGAREARAMGIATVHQDFGSMPLMTVGRNFVVGAEPVKGFWPFRYFDVAKANKIAVEQISGFGITRVRSGDQLVGTLSGGERQVLAIARAMYFGAKVLILDEPTSALGVKEAAKVISMIEQVKKQGVGIVFITHNARHAMMVGDNFVVLARGRSIASFRAGERSREELLALMSGDESLADPGLAKFEDDAEALAAS